MTPLAKRADQAAFISFAACVVLGPLALALQETTLVCAIIAWLIAAGLQRNFPRTALNGAILLFLAATALSLFNTTHLPTSLKGVQKILKVLACFFAAASVVQTRQRLHRLILLMMAAATFVCLDGFLQLILGIEPLTGRSPGFSPGGIARITATFDHPNNFAVYAVTVFPVCLMMALDDEDKRVRLWAWGLCLLLAASLTFTFSRPAMVAVPVAMTLFFILRRAWKTLGLSIAGGVLGIFCLPASIKAWMAAQPSWLHALTQPDRLEAWDTARRMIVSHPWFGIGANLFVRSYTVYKSPLNANPRAFTAHNHYLQLAAETGLLGLAAFLFLLFCFFRLWRKLNGHRQPWVRTAALGLGCGIVAFLAIGLLESALQSSRCNLFFWLWLGVFCALEAEKPVKSKSLCFDSAQHLP